MAAFCKLDNLTIGTPNWSQSIWDSWHVKNKSLVAQCCSLSSLLLILLLLFLLVLVTSTGLLRLVVSEFFDQEGAHDALFDLTTGVDTTVCARDRSLGRSHSLEIVWPGNLNTLHLSSLGVFLYKMKNKLSTYIKIFYDGKRWVNTKQILPVITKPRKFFLTTG